MVKNDKNLKKNIIDWLNNKSKEDIEYTKRNYEITIFLKHPGITDFDVRKIVDEPEKKILKVERTPKYDNRLLITRKFSNNFNHLYIILDPFDENLESKYKNKVAVVTLYPNKLTTKRS